jgi:hypothetical protein
LHIAFTIRGSKLLVTMPNLKFTTETISLRMPVPLLHAIKGEANRRNVPYQSLIKLCWPSIFRRRKSEARVSVLTQEDRNFDHGLHGEHG